MNMEISVQFLFAEQSALKPPPLIPLFSAVQELCGNKVFYSVRTRIRDNLIYQDKRSFLGSSNSAYCIHITHTKNLFHALKTSLLKRCFGMIVILFSYQTD